MRKGLAPDDLGDLLELPRVAVLAMYRRDATVLLSPVWHNLRDNGFNVVTGPRDVKARAPPSRSAREPRRLRGDCPYRGLELRARARLSTPEDRSISAGSLRGTSARKRVNSTPRLQATTCSSAWSRASCAPGISPTTSPDPRSPSSGRRRVPASSRLTR